MQSGEEIHMLRKLSENAAADFQELLEVSEDAICIAEPAGGVIIRMNSKVAMLIGRRKDAVIPPLIADLPGFSPEISLDKISRAFADGPQTFEWNGTLNGRFNRLMITVKPSAIMGSMKVMVFLRQVNTPQTNLIHDGLEVEQSSVPAENPFSMVWSIDTQLRLISANKLFYKTIEDALDVKLKPGDHILNTVTEKFPDDHVAFWGELYQKALLGESFIKEVYRPAIIGRSGGWREISFHPIYENDTVTGIICSSKDITEQKEAEQQQSLYAFIIRSSEDAVITTNMDGIVTSWNPGAERLYGYTTSEIIGSHALIIPPDFVEENMDILRRIANGEHIEHFETWRQRKDGSKVNVSLSISPIIDAHGKIIGSSKISRDITEKLKHSEEAKNALEERNAILESIGDAFFALDKNWIITYWNNRSEAMTGLTAKQVLNRNIWELFPESLNTISFRNYHKAAATNTKICYENYNERLGKWFEISIYPSVRGLSVYFKDISERKEAELQLKDLNQILQQHAKELAISNSELEQFAYVASHDLQEPLRMVTSFLTQLEKKYEPSLDDRGKKYIAFAVDGAKRMRQMILDLLEFSRAGRHDDRMEHVDLNEIVSEISILFRKNIEERKAVITSDKLPVISGYRSPLRQVFQNLIGNAIKYTAEDVTPEIHISVTDHETELVFCISDNGIGIDKEYFEKIFVIFQRLHNRDEYSGTGMGLAITKKIIENAGGKIWVESSEHKGSRFYFTLKKEQ